jgi:single-stranded-DNA-specific exonuclease
LLLAVDCGSTAVECIDAIRKEGRDIIVLDHHQLSDPPPRATAMVNPRKLLPDGQEGGGEFQELCSVGLAFKLAHALLKRGRQMGLEGAADFDLKTVLDLVALGTIADLVPLTGENRILVTAGLERLRATTRLGLVWLKRVAGCADAAIEPHHVGYQLAPRLNAVGRLQTAEQALTLLLTKDEQQARDLAEALDRCNRERQNLERDIAEQALSAVLKRYNPESDYVIVEGNVSWHIGVVGIVASRLLQQFHRPTIVVGGDGERWRGSGRSIDGFDLAEALRHCSDLLVRHGGHAMAAGVTVLPEQIDAFRSRLNEFARRTLKSEQLSPVLRLDGQVGFNELTADSLNHLAKLMPTGQGNPAPQFCARNVSHRAPPVRISQGKHVKMQVTDGHTVLETLWWSPGGAELPSGRFDIAFAPQLSTYNGRTKVQLKLLDWCPAQSF